jgi:hypothetical protein
VSKTILLCADGTWNGPGEPDHGVRANVAEAGTFDVVKKQFLNGPYAFVFPHGTGSSFSPVMTILSAPSGKHQFSPFGFAMMRPVGGGGVSFGFARGQ